MKRKSIIGLLLVFTLILGACGGAGTAVTQVETVEAAAMRLVRTEGEVALSDEAEEHIPIVENMRLFSGNALATGTESRAGISLDEAKTVTLGGESGAELGQKGRRLQMRLRYGELYFNVSEPLEKNESFQIETASMTLSIRGTTGYVVSEEENRTGVILTSGSALIQTPSGPRQAVRPGEMVTVETDEEGMRITVTALTEWELPALLLEELAGDPAALERTLEESPFSREALQAAIEGTEPPEDSESVGRGAEIYEYDPEGNLRSHVRFRSYLTDTGELAVQEYRYDSLGRTLYLRTDFEWGAYDMDTYSYDGTLATFEHESWGYDRRYHTGESFQSESGTYQMESPENLIRILEVHLDYPDREKNDANVTLVIGEFRPGDSTEPIREQEYWFEMAYRWTSY